MFVYSTSLGSQWLSKEDLEKLTVEKLSDHEVIQFLNNSYFSFILTTMGLKPVTLTTTLLSLLPPFKNSVVAVVYTVKS